MTELGQPSVIAETTMTTSADLDHITPWINQVLTVEPPSDLPTVVVSHSAACPRTPLLVDHLVDKGWSIDAMILVDGRFPTGQAFTVSVPGYGAMLDGMVRPDDYLPPWPRWWGSLVSGLVVDPVARDLVFNEAAPVPRTWFDQGAPVPDLPADIGRGFLSFGPGYAEACDQAHEAVKGTVKVGTGVAKAGGHDAHGHGGWDGLRSRVPERPPQPPRPDA
jgi:hypothetical protein